MQSVCRTITKARPTDSIMQSGRRAYNQLKRVVHSLSFWNLNYRYNLIADQKGITDDVEKTVGGAEG